MTMPATAPPVPTHALLHVDDSDHWLPAARMLGAYLRHVDGRATIVATQLLASHRARALERARQELGLPPARAKGEPHAGLAEVVVPEVARALRVGLVAMGRLGSMDRITSGLVAQRVVRRTPASALVARGKGEAPRSILVCIEGAEHADADLDLALAFARAFDARLTLLHVLSQMRLSPAAAAPEPEAFLASDDATARALLALRDRARDAGVRCGAAARAGLVVEETLDQLRDGRHDLLVVGANDPSAPGAGLLEDFSSLILRASPVSTLVVRDARRRQPE